MTRATLFLALTLMTLESSHISAKSLSLIEIRSEDDAREWRPVLDGVMGGLSRGRSAWADGAARFEGRVSLDNNGGFASFRRDVPLPDLTAYDGLRLRVRGDGQVYKLSLRTEDGWRSPSWQAPFSTQAGEWTTIDLPFSELVPTWRGRLISDAGPLDASSIEEVGVIIADKQEGSFQIELSSIHAWRATEADSEDATEMQTRTRELAEILDLGANTDQLASGIRARERALVVASETELDALASKQIGRLLTHASDLADRDLRIVQLMGSGGGFVAGRTITQSLVSGLRDRWSLPTGEWTLALVGKDGEVKARWNDLAQVDEIFELIDAMPMRQQEMNSAR